jgi:glycosyltransferase involved in cell wall biosynthesis
MHILYLHQYFVPPDGAGGTRSYEMGRRLVQAGHRVTLVTSSSAFPSHYHFSRWCTSLEIDGIKLLVVKINYNNSMSYFSRVMAFSRFAIGALFALFRAKAVDVVFATSTPLTIALPGFFAKVIHQCPMVFEVRDLWPELPIAIGALNNKATIWMAGKLEKMAYHQSIRVIALSPGMAEGIAKTAYPENRIEIIPNSCDTALFKVPQDAGSEFIGRNPHLSSGPLLVYTGTLGRINGVGYLVDIAKEMMTLRPEVCFQISGWGKEMPLVEEKATRLGVLGKNLWLTGPIPKAEMPQLLSAAALATSLFVDMPEMWSNSANKFFDALAAGRPVAINYEGWQADFLRETGAGVVLPPSDPKASAIILCEFLDDEPRVQQSRRAAVEASETIFNRDLLATKLIKTLEGAVAEQRT